MGDRNNEILIRLDLKRAIVLALFMILTVYTITSYVNAMASYRPSFVSAYGPWIPPNKVPIARAGPNQEVFVNQTVYLDGSESEDVDGNIELYSWTFGDGESATGVSVSHKYAKEGVYEVELTVKDDDGATEDDAITITVRKPTTELISPLSPEDSAKILEEIQVETSLDIILNLNLTQAVKIAQALNKTTLLNIVEAAINLDQTTNMSKILSEMELGYSTIVILDLDPDSSAQVLESITEFNFTIRDLIIETGASIDKNKTAFVLALMDPQLLPEILIETEDDLTTRVMFDLDASQSAQILKSMVGLNTTKSALVIETSVSIDQDKTAVILELVETQTLLDILIEISQMPTSPSTAATIIELLSIEKAVELSKAWISSDDIQELGIVMQFLSSDTLNSIFENLTISERSSLYQILSSETVSKIQSELLPLPDMAITSFTVTRLGTRGYHLNGTIENQGSIESGTFLTHLLIDDELVEQYQISVLTPGKSTMFSFEWKPTSKGVYNLEAIVDPTSVIKENDETNNMISMTYGVELPDLAVVFTTTSTELVEGESVTLNVEISNIGEEEATEVDIIVEGSGLVVQDGDVGWISIDVGSSVIDRLPPGSTETLDFSWIPEIGGSYTMVAIADPLEKLLEGVRENNFAELQIEVEARARLNIYMLAIAGIAVLALAGALYLYRAEVSRFINKYI